MSLSEIQELRNDLVDWLSGIKDEQVLQVIQSLKQSVDRSTTSDWWNTLPQSTIQDIQQGLQDIEDGNVLTSSQFWDAMKARRS